MTVRIGQNIEVGIGKSFCLRNMPTDAQKQKHKTQSNWAPKDTHALWVRISVGKTLVWVHQTSPINSTQTSLTVEPVTGDPCSLQLGFPVFE